MNQFLLQNISILPALMCPEAAPAEVPDLRRNGMLPDSAGPERVHGCSSCSFCIQSAFLTLHSFITAQQIHTSKYQPKARYLIILCDNSHCFFPAIKVSYSWK